MTNLDSILKSRDIILSTKVHLVKAVVFPVVMYGCESWTIKKGECWRIDAFELWCWRSHPKRDQSWDWSLKGLILKLKLQYFGHLMRRVDSFEKTLMLGGTGGRRRRGWQRMRWLNGITDSMDMGLRWTPGIGNGQGGLECCSSWGHRVGHDWVTELNCHYRCCKSIYCVLLYIDAELWNMFLNIIWNFIKNLD